MNKCRLVGGAVMQTLKCLGVNVHLTGPQRHREDHENKSRCRHGLSSRGQHRSDDFDYKNIGAAVWVAAEVQIDRLYPIRTSCAMRRRLDY